MADLASLRLSDLTRIVPEGLTLARLGQTWPARMARDAYSAFLLPGQVYRGEVPMWGPDGQTNTDVINRSVDLAGLAMGGSSFGPTGAIGAGPSGLRERYASYLRQASGGKDPMRIKLTPERIEAAKQDLQSTLSTILQSGGASPYRRTGQAQAAASFAQEAKRMAIDDVRVKFPEGPYGSVYVRVGENGTVRFADHPPPVEGGKVVGGYSRVLGRRHHPATIDVSRGRYTDIDPSPAYEWLRGLSGN